MKKIKDVELLLCMAVAAALAGFVAVGIIICTARHPESVILILFALWILRFAVRNIFP